MMLILALLIQAPDPIPLWPQLDYSEELKAKFGAEKIDERPGRRWRFISNVTVPELFVYKAPEPNGAAVVICPGGGYGGVAIDHEGHDVARWLNGFGVTGIVVKYRMPKVDITKDATPWPQIDAQRAIRTARHRAKEWGIAPDRIGVMGFSAGGHLASTVGTHYDAGDPKAKDPIDQQGCRPDFMILVYPVISFQEGLTHGGSRNALIGKDASKERIDLYSNELQVNAKTPPAFLVHTVEDKAVKIDNSRFFHEALKKAGVATELAVYEKGPHGFGLGEPGTEAAAWPDRCKAWLEAQKLLKR